ncbi:MAG: NADAR family protein [Gammaproteobacteria bacterium]|nr:NADAR family protein [Gammaproteobacteria bacterium]
MIFNTTVRNDAFVSRQDATNPLSTYSKHKFELDDAEWPSAEHYYQAMKFEDDAIREQIRQAPNPKEAAKLAKKHKRQMRKDWKAIKTTVMKRGMYIKCRTHEEVADALMQTGDKRIVENTQFDYYWGCGRDGRGENMYGKILMDIREKLSEQE